MTTLTGRLINNTYKQLLKIGVSTNTGITSSLVTIKLDTDTSPVNTKPVKLEPSP